MNIEYKGKTFHKNQNVKLSLQNKYLKIITKQSKSTPGIYFYEKIEPNETYIFKSTYSIKSKKNVVKFWFVYNNGKLIEIFNIKNNNNFKKIIVSKVDAKIKIGILFINPRIDDILVIKDVVFEKTNEEEKGNYFIIEKKMIDINDNIFNIKNLNKIVIKWKKSVSIPSGIEEPFFNCMNDILFFSCGFNGGCIFSYNKNITDRKVIAGKYNRDLKTQSYYFDLNQDTEWIQIEDFPGIKRQGGRAVVCEKKMYCYGGNTFIPNNTHDKKIVLKQRKKAYRTLNDGYCLEYNKKYIWSKLPDLPIPVSGFGMTKIDNYLYVCCGAFKDTKSESWQLTVKNTDIGEKLYKLDINNLDKGWEEHDIFPGTSRFNLAMTSIDYIIYIIGGIYPNDDWTHRSISKKERFYNVMDNWKYDTLTKKWATSC
jgi:hypothetical protein